MSDSRPCLLCGALDHRAVFHERGVDALRCEACGHVFSAWEGEADYEGYWDGKTEAADVAFWRDAHEAMYAAFLRRFVREPEGRLLDVGSGLGFFVAKMQRERPGWETHGCEISPDAARYARESAGAARVHEGRVEDAGFAPASFDRITLWDVLEHLKAPDGLLAHLAGLLRPDGLLFLHTPNANLQLPKARLRVKLQGMRDDLQYLEVKEHLHLYTPATVRRLLERNGFTGVRCVHLPPIGHADGMGPTLGPIVKALWGAAVRTLDRASGGAWNLDNLFVVAKPRSRAPDATEVDVS